MAKAIGFKNVDEENSFDCRKEKKGPDELSYSLLDKFCEKYAPVMSIEKSTNQLTTAEITKAICMFSADRNFKSEHVKDELIKRGYKYCVEIEGYKIVFKWLVMEVL